MADNTIRIETGGSGGASGTAFDGTAIADLNKAINDLANYLKDLPNAINKSFSSNTSSGKSKEFETLQNTLLKQQLSNAEKEAILLKRKEEITETDHRDTMSTNSFFKRSVETFFGSQLLNRINSVTNASITSNPLGSPVQRATQNASNMFGAGVDVASAVAAAIDPVLGLAVYGLGSVVGNVYTAFKGQSETEAYNKYFLGSNYLTRSFASDPTYDPNKNNYFAQAGAVAGGYASTGTNINLKEATLISSLGEKMGINPTDLGSFSKLGSIIGQFGNSVGDLDKTVKIIKSYQENYGGGLSNVQAALALYQGGATTSAQAFDMAFQNPHMGAAFASRADQFVMTPYIQRFQQETLGKALIGVDLEQMYTGTPAQQNAQRAKMAAYIGRTSTSTENFSPGAAFLGMVGVQGQGFINSYKAVARNKSLLHDPSKIGDFDPATQSVLNAQKAIVNIASASVSLGKHVLENMPGMPLQNAELVTHVIGPSMDGFLKSIGDHMDNAAATIRSGIGMY